MFMPIRHTVAARIVSTATNHYIFAINLIMCRISAARYIMPSSKLLIISTTCVVGIALFIIIIVALAKSPVVGAIIIIFSALTTLYIYDITQIHAQKSVPGAQKYNLFA